MLSVVGVDHPATTLTSQEETAFLNWLVGKLNDYEAATGLTRYTGETP